MKELSNHFAVISEAASNPQPPVTRRYRETARWRVAKSRKDDKQKSAQNGSTECSYHEVIVKVKELIVQYGGDTLFECDYKNDPDSYTNMHSFVTSTFFWRLDCELFYNYEVYFAFHNCPYEAVIRKMMLAYPLDRTTHEKTFPQGYSTFYKRVLEVQNPTHITSIKVTGLK